MRLRGMSFYFMNRLHLRTGRLLQSSDNSVDVDPRRREILQHLHNHVDSLLELSKASLDTELDRAIYEEYSELQKIEAKIQGGAEFSMEEVENLKQKMDSFALRLKMLEEQHGDGLYNSFPDINEKKEKEDAAPTEIIGVSDVYQKVKDSLMSSDYLVTSLVGMPGIGKTAVAKKLFQDLEVVERFQCRVWVRVGKGCRFKDIPGRILAEMDPETAYDLDSAHMELKVRLESETCLVVLDNVWDPYMAFLLRPSTPNNKTKEIFHYFVPNKTASRFLVISRLQRVDHQDVPFAITMRLMDKDESWELLQEKMFPQLSCPPELEKAGKKIAENCEGLPLTILAVANLLSNEERTPEFWTEVATRKNHRLFKNAYDQISEVLLPSYTYLPRILQICFLFMGLFRRNYKIRPSKLINLCRADGFYNEINIKTNLDNYVMRFLEELVSNNLVMVYQKSIPNWHYIKTCGLHSSLWHLSNKIAWETKFSIILDSRDDGLDDAIRGYPRLSFHNNVLFGLKDVRESVENKCAQTTRALLCYGPYQQYQVPLCCRLGLLRELDADSIRFYQFPLEVLQLVELRYLTLTVNGAIPAPISRLSKLQFLIVERHMNIKSGRVPCYLPVEIWDLKGLEHLQITGSDLPDPCGASLENLSALLNVSASSCTEAVLDAVPNLSELRIRIECAPGDDGQPLSVFAHVPHHIKLKFVKCVIVHPGVLRPIMPLGWSKYLDHLSLSGLGYSWNEMSKIALLPYLHVLKLKNYAFQGPKWDVEERAFPLLSCLVIEDTDLVDWQIGREAFKRFSQLRTKNCYKLEKIHGKFDSEFIRIIEIFDCNPLFVEEMKQAVKDRTNKCVVHVQSSWVDSKRRT